MSIALDSAYVGVWSISVYALFVPVHIHSPVPSILVQKTQVNILKATKYLTEHLCHICLMPFLLQGPWVVFIIWVLCLSEGEGPDISLTN